MCGYYVSSRRVEGWRGGDRWRHALGDCEPHRLVHRRIEKQTGGDAEHCTGARAWGGGPCIRIGCSAGVSSSWKIAQPCFYRPYPAFCQCLPTLEAVCRINHSTTWHDMKWMEHVSRANDFLFQKKDFSVSPCSEVRFVSISSVFMHQRLCYFRNFIINVRTFNGKSSTMELLPLSMD